MTEHDHDLLPDDQPPLPAGEAQREPMPAGEAKPGPRVQTALIARTPAGDEPPREPAKPEAARAVASPAGGAANPVAGPHGAGTPVPALTAASAAGPDPAPEPAKPSGIQTRRPKAARMSAQDSAEDSGRDSGRRPGRTFLSWPLGASLVYLVSAACILLGAALVLAPAAADELRIVERFAMAGTLFSYQLALAGVILLVCRWRRGHPDAVALSVLVAVFLAAAPAGLDTVALQQPVIAFGCGLIACGAAVLIGGRWQGEVGGRLPTGLAAALMLAVAAADLGPGCLGLVWHDDLDRLRRSWLVLWSLVLGAGMVFALAARSAGADPGDHLRPLVERSGFRWTLGLLLGALFGLHQWLLAYACGLELGWGDFLPYALILTVAGGELRVRLLGSSGGLAWVYGLALLPVVVGIDPAASQFRFVWHDQAFSLLPGCMALMAASIARQSWRWRDLAVAVVAVVWGSGAVATWGRGLDQQTVNIASSVGFLALGLSVLGVGARNPGLLMATPLVAAVAVLFIPALQTWMWRHEVDPRSVYALILGLGWLAAHAAFPRLLSGLAAGLGGTALALGAMGVGFSADASPLAPVAAAFAVLALCAAEAWWTRTRAALIPGMVPSALGVLWLLDHHRAWILVPVAFALLAVGARLSRRTALAV